MRRYLGSLLLVVCILKAVVVMPQELVTKEMATKAALSFVDKLRKDTLGIGHSSSLGYRTLVSDNRVLIHEIHIDSFRVWVSGVMSCKPIIAYQIDETDDYLLDVNDECGLSYFLDRYSREVLFALDSVSDKNIVHPDWEKHPKVNQGKSQTSNRIGPLIKTRWNQNSSNDGRNTNAYNYLVSDTNRCTGDTCLAGCVPVAFAQVMNFYKHPAYMEDSCYQFDWCNMPNELRMSDPQYEKHRFEIARLLRVVGLSFDAKYCGKDTCQSGTGADQENAITVLKRYYGYSRTATEKKRRRYSSDSAWVNLLIGELQLGHPIVYTGWKPGGSGHSFVCHGYDFDNEMFDINFGWGWNNDAHMTINPIGFSAASANYTENNRAAIGLYPDPNSLLFCNYEMTLNEHYQRYYSNHSEQTLPPYENVPNIFKVIESCDESTPSSWRTIPSGAHAEYKAHQEIYLRPGFHAEAGSEFHAYIEPCDRCENEAQSQQSPPHGEQPGVQGDETMLAPADSAFWTICPSGENSDVRIHPNPTTGEITINYTQPSGNWTRCELYDQQGRHLRTLLNRTQPAGTYTESLSLASLPAGTYLLVLRNQARTSTQRIVKQ